MEEKLIKLLACSTRCKLKIVDVLWLFARNSSAALSGMNKKEESDFEGETFA